MKRTCIGYWLTAGLGAEVPEGLLAQGPGEGGGDRHRGQEEEGAGAEPVEDKPARATEIGNMP